jgi:hypothetical protein
LRKDNRNRRACRCGRALSPERGVFALRTAGLLVLPVDHTLVDVVGPLYSSLPTAVGAGGADEGDALIILTTDQQGSIDRWRRYRRCAPLAAALCLPTPAVSPQSTGPRARWPVSCAHGSSDGRDLPHSSRSSGRCSRFNSCRCAPAWMAPIGGIEVRICPSRNCSTSWIISVSNCWTCSRLVALRSHCRPRAVECLCRTCR